MTTKPRYVLMLVFSRELDKVVLLIKKHGPSFLRNKRTFPGGHIEEGEEPFAAGTREMQEETGLDVPLWTEACVITDLSEMHVLAGTSANIHDATDMTDEPVEVWSVSDLTLAQARAPEDFAPDLMPLLSLALSKLREGQRAAQA